MPRRYLQRKPPETNSGKNDHHSDPQEFYLMEKLYDAIRKDKSQGKRPSVKEFYLMEKLYEAIRKDKEKNHRNLAD